MSEFVRGIDAAWFRMDRPENLMVVNAVLWFDGPARWDDVRDVIRERLISRYPRFSQRVARGPLGTFRWERDRDFDLDHHLHHVELPVPGDRDTLGAVVAERLSTPLDPARPLWEMLLVDGFEGGSAILARMHHAIADGLALVQVLLSTVDEEAGAPLAAPSGSSPLGVVRGVADPLFGLVRHPSRVPALAGDIVAETRVLAKEVFLAPDGASGLHGKLGVDKKVAWSDPVPISALKEAAGSSGGTLNDVVLAALTGALRRRLEAAGAPAQEVRALVPFNIRRLDKPLSPNLGNSFGLVFVSLPTGIEDAGARLLEVKRRMDGIKHSPEGVVSSEIMGMIGTASPYVAAPLIRFFASKATLVMTNVPGPKVPVHLAGHPIKGAFGWVPVSGGIGLGVACFSYAGSVTLAVAADPRVVPDPQALVEDFTAEVELLRRPAPRPRRAHKRPPRATPKAPATPKVRATPKVPAGRRSGLQEVVDGSAGTVVVDSVP